MTDTSERYTPLTVLADADRPVPAAFEWRAADFTGGRVSLGYWQRGDMGRDIQPLAAARRVKRLHDYECLYRGDWSPLGLQPREAAVRGDEFARIADTYAALLMAFPPVLAPSLPDEFDADTLTIALTEAVADLVRYGTAILYPSEGRVERLDPRYWYPDMGTARAAYIHAEQVASEDGREQREHIVNVTLFEGDTERRTYWRSPDGRRFGEQLAVDEGYEDAGEFIPQVVAIPPLTDGYWGTSLFERMVHTVAELTRRASGAGNILRRHEQPRVKASRSPDAGPPIFTGSEQQAQLVFDRAQLDEAYDADVIVPMYPYTDIEYMSYDGQLAASFNQRESLRDELAAITGIPTALYGVLRGGGIPSGTALRATYARAFAQVELIHSVLIPKVRRALALATDGQEFTIEWANPLDELSVSRIEQVSAPTPEAAREQDAIQTGRPEPDAPRIFGPNNGDGDE